MSLFVDIDDTLVLYDLDTPNPCEIYDGTKYEINTKLVRNIMSFYSDNPETLIVIWSGGGREYVKGWVNKLGLEDMAVALSKDRDTLSLIKDGDIVIDDDDLFGKRTHSPMDGFGLFE